MHYKRNEAFRYQFKENITAEITMEGRTTHAITIIDVSPKGMKLRCAEKIPVNSNICIKYKILEGNLQVNGLIVWQIDYGEFYLYGVSLEDSETYQTQLIKELKRLAKTKPQ
ncbi:PilZ domain-containing protein [Gracilibacillus massiliensis]|uniref:PilZ domain-containing protein n=1 Tax=Gracilibacillus massiliensis TaxID=1564956 RepID=UPI00071C2B83|nr:PilZ domain-containing protein [Gracilibacillus massiliensis]